MTRSRRRELNLPFVAGLAIAAGLSALAVPPASAEGNPPGYAGDAACAECHSDVAEAFGAAAHGRADLAARGAAGSCESCHGPGQAHIDAGGEAAQIGSFKGRQGAAACLSCHEGAAMAHWQEGAHSGADLSCTSCHRVHQPWTADRALARENETATCLSCHGEMRRSLYARSGHPLRHGQMSCTDCHDPHGSGAAAMVSALTVNEKCYECHAETRGPFLWEHAPVRDNCLTCHDPHGSSQAKLLTVAAPRLCQSCHLFGHHQTVPGFPDQIWNQNRACLNCHSKIHGSNHPSGIVLMR